MEAVVNLQLMYPRLIEGDTPAIGVFDENAFVHAPLAGDREPAEFLAETRDWLAERRARSEPIHTVVTADRIVHELNLYLRMGPGDEETELPVMLVADAACGLIGDLRVYHSTWPLTGSHMLRRPVPILRYTLDERPPEPVGTYHQALMDGDADAADSVYEADGTVREPAGGTWVYSGTDRTAWYRMILSAGPIVLHLATITDDGETVVYEYAVDQWGPEKIPEQAGAAAYQRGPSGKLQSTRIYDDVTPPPGLAEE